MPFAVHCGNCFEYFISAVFPGNNLSIVFAIILGENFVQADCNCETEEENKKQKNRKNNFPFMQMSPVCSILLCNEIDILCRDFKLISFLFHSVVLPEFCEFPHQAFGTLHDHFIFPFKIKSNF